MNKILNNVFYSLEDNSYYLKESNDKEYVYGKKIVVYDNKVRIDDNTKKLDSNNIEKRIIAQTNYLEMGDVVYINSTEYICLYHDKEKTLLFRRILDNNVDNLYKIPARELYIKTGTATKDELKKVYKEFLIFRGLFKGPFLDAIDGSMKRLLEIK